MSEAEFPVGVEGVRPHAGLTSLRAVREVSQALLEGRETDQVLVVIARWARLLAGAVVASVATPDPTGQWVAVQAADGIGAEVVEGFRRPFDDSLTQEVMLSGRPRIVDAATETSRQPITLIPGMGPTLLVPMTVDGRAFGTLAVANPAGAPPFSADDLLVVQTFADEAALAIEYGQARRDLARLSVLEERERIAMELHDGVVQPLFVAGLALQAVEAVVDDPDQTRARLAEAVASIDRAIRDLRDYIFGLGPAEADHLRLERDLRELADQMHRSGRVVASVELDPVAVGALSFRGASIVQAAREAMSNAVRHSGGDRVFLRLCTVGGEVRLEVVDNGRGFDPAGYQGRGRGLANLRTRVESMGGTLEIESEPGTGATVRLRLPQ